MKIGMTSVYVNNTEDAFKFYTEVLNFVEVLYMPEANLAIVASPEDKEGTALLLEPNESPIAKTYQEQLFEKGLPCIVMTTDDLQKEYNRLASLGVEFRKKPTPTEWGIESVFNDNCGNWIQLQQLPV